MPRLYQLHFLLLSAALSACSSPAVAPDAGDPEVALPDVGVRPDASLDADLWVMPDISVPRGPQADGAACTDDSGCVGGTCKTGDGFPEGFCTLDGCDGGCGDGSECSYSSEFGIFCAPLCEAQDDCRTGYACRAQGVPGDLHRLCTPIRGVPDGEPCAEAADCQGGTCLPWPDGYCTTNRCDTDDDCASIGGYPNTCVDDGQGGICLRSCSETPQCRAGYLCTDIGGGATFCLEDPARPIDDTVFAPSPLGIQCGIPVVNGAARIDYTIAPTTTSYMIAALARDGQPLHPSGITLPDGTERNFNRERGFLTLSADLLKSISPTLVPPGPAFTDMLAAGNHTLRLTADGRELCYYLVEKQAPGATLTINAYLVGVPGITSANAPTNSDFGAVFAELERILGQAQISIAQVRYFDVTPDDAAAYSVVRSEADFGAIAKLGHPPGTTLDSYRSVDLFFLAQIALSDVTVGYANALPGPAALHGTHGSGVILTSEYMGGPAEDTFGQPTDGNTYTALIAAHELGHWLGLQHTSDRLGGHDHLADTPECANPNDAETCPDWGNLMFPLARAGSDALTADQGWVLRANPATQP